MKTLYLISVFAITALVGISNASIAQVAINTNGAEANASSLLDVSSTTKGILVPRMTSTERDAISNPATGLLIYQTNLSAFVFYNGSTWVRVGDGVGATSINGLSDGVADGTSVFLGSNAGANDDGNNYNVTLGNNTLYYNVAGENNSAVGNMAQYISHGTHNTSVGNSSLRYNSTGNYNSTLGSFSLRYNQTGSNNTAIGYMAGSGTSNHSKSGGVFLGYMAGYAETTNNKLYIENSNSTSPLIYGEFDNDLLRINGDLDITGSLSGVAINNLSDAITGGNSIFLGSNAGSADDATDNQNVGLGINALKSNTSGYYNSAIGYDALYTNTSGNHNTAIGREALKQNSIGGSNTAIGVGALYHNGSGYDNTATGLASLYSNTSGDYNTADGFYSLYNNTTGEKNVGIGYGANRMNEGGSNNTIIGYEAGYGGWGHSKSGNVFIGFQAGYSEISDNTLYIENSSSSTPLIKGNFNTDYVTIYGNLGVGTSVFGNGSRTLSLINGTIPNASISDGVLLYAEDITSTSELKVRDEAGNITTLSPHNFSIAPKSEPMAWSYYSENAKIGQTINIDMLRTVRLVEQMSGEKLVYLLNAQNNDLDKEINKGEIDILKQQLETQNKLIEELVKRIEELENK